MLKRLLPVTLLVALAVPAGAEAAVTIDVGKNKYREVLYGGSFRLKGKTGDYRGNVTLEIDEFPYDAGFAQSGTVQTNSKGEYVFPRVAPSRNAKVRVRAGSQESKAIELFVHPDVKFRWKEISGNRVKTSFTYYGHPGFAPPENAFYVYMARSGEQVFRRLGGPYRMQQVGDGVWRFAGVFDEPQSRRRYRYSLVFCTKGLSAAGYGRFWPIDHGCGKKSIRS